MPECAWLQGLLDAESFAHAAICELAAQSAGLTVRMPPEFRCQLGRLHRGYLLHAAWSAMSQQVVSKLVLMSWCEW